MAERYVADGYVFPFYANSGITIQWRERIIFVPKTEMTLIQSVPIEIRELDLNLFRLTLLDLEDDPAGIAFVNTHNHNPPVTISGIQLARVIEIINSYTVTFEDGIYAVNLLGANTNLADVVNPNSVSVRTSNSAGLVQTAEIQNTAYVDTIYIDPLNGTSRTSYPAGTRAVPVKYLSEAKIISTQRSISTFKIIGNLVIGATDNIDGFTLRGNERTHDTVTLTPGCSTDASIFERLTVTGTASGAGLVFRNCAVTDVLGISGQVIESTLRGTISVAPGGTGTEFTHCFDGPGQVEIDLGGSGTVVSIRDFFGGLLISNKTGSEDCSISFAAGRLIIDSTVSNGAIVVSGNGYISADNHTGTATVSTVGLVGNQSITDYVWDEPIASHVAPGSTGEKLNAAGSAGDPWTTDLSTYVTPGTAGYIVKDINSDSNQILSTGVSINSVDQSVINQIWNEAAINHVSVGSLGQMVNQIKTDTGLLSIDVTTMLGIVETLQKYSANRTRINKTAFTLTVYDNDGTTPIKVFDLKDATGTPSITEIIERVPQ